VDYLAFVHAPEHQRGVYFDAGGQPGLRSAWVDERVNHQSGRYFLNTLDTLESAYRRPRFDGFVPFMKRTGELVHDMVVERKDPAALALELCQSYERAREGI
jgi:multiple sugar transport system substrate-binding protein